MEENKNKNISAFTRSEEATINKNEISMVLIIFYMIMSLVIPLVGFCMYLVWRDDRPKQAKYIGIGALIGFLIYSIILVGTFIYQWIRFGPEFLIFIK